jgi:hypothetical protein
MSRKSHTVVVALIAALAVAVVAPAAVAQPVMDLRSPDAQSADRVAVIVNGKDLRSPDAREAARPSTGATPAPSSGTDWGEIGMIAGAVVLGLLAVGAIVYIVRRRDTLSQSGTTVTDS